MPTYRYKAKRGPGDDVSGQVEAQSRQAALAQLDSRGLTPVWVREDAETARPGDAFGFRRIRPRDVSLFTRQLASMLRAGVPILRALATVAEQAEHPRFRRLLAGIEASVRDGNMLSEALSRHPAVFRPLYLSMVRAGESAGVLDTVLDRLAEDCEHEEDLRRQVQSALAYPMLILAVSAVTVFVLLTFFLPRVVALYRDFSRLPLPTQALIRVSDFFSRHGIWLAAVAVLLVAAARRASAAGRGRSVLDRLKLNVPIVSRLVHQADLARFARTLSLLVRTGIPIDRALALSADTMRNVVLREEVEAVRRNTVQMGHPLSAGLRRSVHFPPLVANMTAVGEESGRLDEVLAEVASFYEKDLEQQIRLVTSLLGPVLILGVGVVVGFIVVAMLLPVFQIGSAM